MNNKTKSKDINIEVKIPNLIYDVKEEIVDEGFSEFKSDNFVKESNLPDTFFYISIHIISDSLYVFFRIVKEGIEKTIISGYKIYSKGDIKLLLNRLISYNAFFL